MRLLTQPLEFNQDGVIWSLSKHKDVLRNAIFMVRGKRCPLQHPDLGLFKLSFLISCSPKGKRKHCRSALVLSRGRGGHFGEGSALLRLPSKVSLVSSLPGCVKNTEISEQLVMPAPVYTNSIAIQPRRVRWRAPHPHQQSTVKAWAGLFPRPPSGNLT